MAKYQQKNWKVETCVKAGGEHFEHVFKQTVFAGF